ncbi:MAG: hypothetical protein WCI62_01865 [Erysipelotrichaceae bacterium]
MTSFFSLVRVSLINSFGLLDGKTKRNIWKRLFPIFLALAFAPTLVSFYFLTHEALLELIKFQQTGIIISLMVSGLSTLSFVSAIFLIPAVFYFSKDIELLLSYPLKPHIIVGAKLLISVIYEYIFVFFAALPILAAYVMTVQVEPQFYLYLVIVLLLLPVVPLVIAGLIVLLVMSFIPLAKNRDFFNYLSGFFALALALGLNYAVTSSTVNPNIDLVSLLVKGNNSLLNYFKVIFPNIPFANNALIFYHLLDVLFYVGITILFIFVYIFLSKYFYFKAAIGINETGSNRKHLSARSYSQQTTAQKPIFSYAIKELKLLIRTPIYFLNNISIIIILPIIMFGSLFAIKDPDIDKLYSMLRSIEWNNPAFLLYAIGVGLGFGAFSAAINMITCSAISREGSQLYFMKYIPMSYFQQIQAKVYSGLFISVLGVLGFIVPMVIFFNIGYGVAILTIISAFLGTYLINYLGIIVDMIHPKLIWEQEAAPVKQNINIVFVILPAIAISAIYFFFIIKLPSNALVSSLILLALVLLDVSVYMFTKKFSHIWLSNL